MENMGMTDPSSRPPGDKDIAEGIVKLSRETVRLADRLKQEPIRIGPQTPSVLLQRIEDHILAILRRRAR
jgi:hypothetical protein